MGEVKVQARPLGGGAAVSRARSLGTMAMAQPEKRFDSDSSDAESARLPWLPPPPTAPIRVKRVQLKEAPKPVEILPPLPSMLQVPSSPSFVDDGPRSPLLERVKSARKTLMERVEGWWDLGLLEKRQTLFGGKRV